MTKDFATMEKQKLSQSLLSSISILINILHNCWWQLLKSYFSTINTQYSCIAEQKLTLHHNKNWNTAAVSEPLNVLWVQQTFSKCFGILFWDLCNIMTHSVISSCLGKRKIHTNAKPACCPTFYFLSITGGQDITLRFYLENLEILVLLLSC